MQRTSTDLGSSQGLPWLAEIPNPLVAVLSPLVFSTGPHAQRISALWLELEPCPHGERAFLMLQGAEETHLGCASSLSGLFHRRLWLQIVWEVALQLPLLQRAVLSPLRASREGVCSGGCWEWGM